MNMLEYYMIDNIEQLQTMGHQLKNLKRNVLNLRFGKYIYVFNIGKLVYIHI